MSGSADEKAASKGAALQPRPGRARTDEHKVDRGPRLQLGPDGRRWYTVSCLCGWESELSGTAVLAEAAAEQHVTFALASARPKRQIGARPG